MSNAYARSAACLLLIVAGMVHAEEDDNTAKLATSREVWAKAKAACNDTYEYDVVQTAMVSRAVTTIVVRAGQVVERRFIQHNNYAPPNTPPTTWVETQTELGQHKDGAAALTVDQIYAKAAEILGKKRAEHERLLLTINADGLLACCIVVDTRIADDAPHDGVIISTLRPAKQGQE